MTTHKNPSQDRRQGMHSGDRSETTPAFEENIADMPEEKLKEDMAEKMGESSDEKAGKKRSATQKEQGKS